MDRLFVYPGQIPYDTDELTTNRNTLVGLGLLALDILGTSTLASGLACTPTAPASLAVQVGIGRLYSVEPVDATAYGSLAADTTDTILKQGINLSPVVLSCPAPTTAGFSVNYLIEAEYQDSDTANAVLPYYNASNPGLPFSGPNNTGVSQPTQRKGIINLVAKPGSAAATGYQITPGPDTGYVGLYVITVAYGQTVINSGNIATYTGAPFLTETLTQKVSEATGNTLWAPLSAPEEQTFVTTSGETTFTLTYAPVSINSCIVILNGLTLVPTLDFTLSGDVITLTSPTLAGQNLVVYYSTTATVFTPGPGTVTDASLASTSVLYALDKAYRQTANELAASVVPTNYGYPEGNVLRYGADPSGVTSSFAAIQSAVSVACGASLSNGVGNHSRVYFPRGTYKIDADDVFANPLGSTGHVQRGLIFEGDGLMSSILQLSGASSTLWFIDGPANEQQYIATTFRDLGFQGDPTGGPAGLSNGFAMYKSQNLIFERCWFNALGTAYQDAGTANGDATKFVNCVFNNIYTRVIAFDNPQYLNIDLVNCTGETIYGDFFYVAPNGGSGNGGGGCVNMFGGDIILVNNPNATNTWIVNIQAGANLGNNNNAFRFWGVGVSALGTLCGHVNCQFYGGQSPHVTFSKMSFSAQGTARQAVNIAQCHVVYDHCVLTQNSGDTYVVNGPTGGGGDQYGDPGSIFFEACDVPTNLSTYCACNPDSGDSLSWGYISARDCYNSSYNQAGSRYQRIAIDFDLNWSNQGFASNGPRLKRALLKPSNRQWPNATAYPTWQVTLPAGALIVRTVCSRQGSTGTGAYTLQLGYTGNLTAYGSSAASTTGANQSWVQDFNASGNSAGLLGFLLQTTGAGANQIVLSANTTANDASMGNLGEAWIEYY